MVDISTRHVFMKQVPLWLFLALQLPVVSLLVYVLAFGIPPAQPTTAPEYPPRQEDTSAQVSAIELAERWGECMKSSEAAAAKLKNTMCLELSGKPGEDDSCSLPRTVWAAINENYRAFGTACNKMNGL